MPFVELPAPDDGYPDRTISVALDGITYGIRWLWNERASSWGFSLSDVDGTPIIQGVRVAVNADLLARNADPRRPPGAMLVVDPTGELSDPGIDELGNRVKVVYDAVQEEP